MGDTAGDPDIGPGRSIHSILRNDMQIHTTQWKCFQGTLKRDEPDRCDLCGLDENNVLQC